MCNIDWELLSKYIPLITGLVPVGITWFIYTKWHDQKGKEVISNFSKDLLLKDIEIYSNICKFSDENDEDKVDDIRGLVRNYYDNIKLFSLLIDSKKDIEIINNAYKCYRDFNKIIFNPENDLRSNKKEFIHSRNLIKNEYIETLTKYMKYQY